VPLSAEQIQGLGVALNEADWHDLTIDAPAASVDVLLTVLARDESGAETVDPRRTLRLSGCARVAASYRAGTWDDAAAPVVPLDVEGLDRLLRRHGGGPVYGWEFVDSPRGDRDFHGWEHRLSLDLVLPGPGGHSLSLFQDLGGVHHLDLRVWFADVSVLDGAGDRLDLDTFIAAGRRWWEAMYAGERSDRAPSIAALQPGPRPRRGLRGLFRRTPG
jgi:hypothetical protein